jgi:hypothetical protein
VRNSIPIPIPIAISSGRKNAALQKLDSSAKISCPQVS